MIQRLFICIAISIVASSACFAQRTPYSVEPKLLRLKIKDADEAKVRSGRLSVSSDSTVKVGIRRLDVLNEQFGVSNMRRVFPDAGKYEAKHRKYGLHLWYELVLDEDVDPVLAAGFYKATGIVDEAEPVYRVMRINDVSTNSQDSVHSPSSGISRSSFTDDPDFSKQWHYYNDGAITGSVAGVDINLPDAWDITMGSQDIIVAAIDGGIDYNHLDLTANMWVNTAEIPGNGIDDDGNGYVDDYYGYNFYDDIGNILADKHGTHVAGTISAVNNNGIGVAGVAGGPGGGNGVRLMSCQIFEANGVGGATSTDVQRAFMYAADHGAVICQNSWTFNQDPLLLEGIRYFINEAGTDENSDPLPNTPMVGGVVLFAAGNQGSSNRYYPQAYPEVTAVAAIGHDGKRASYSNYGDWVDISAPGGHKPPSTSSSRWIYSTLPGDTYGYDVGTSMACPHVSGVAALILAKHGHEAYTPDSLRARLYASARSLADLEPDYANRMGAGLVDALRALQWVHVSSVALDRTSINLLDGHTTRLIADVQPVNAGNNKVVWSSSKPDCVSVDEDGNIRAFYDKGRSAVITARSVDGGHEATCTVSIFKERVDISDSSVKIMEGQKTRLTASIRPTNIFNRQILWKSSDPSCVSVDSNGNIEALRKGGRSAIITAYSDDGDIEALCTVEVYTEVMVPEGFSPNNDGYNDLFTIILQEGEKYNLRVFDKSGRLHYEGIDYQNNWDGIANKGVNKGKKVPVGTYYYILKSRDEPVKRGYVIIKY
jgi:gliding motility-associated-like protein